MSFVFLSHASADKPRIGTIVDALIGAGLKVWLDNPAAMGYSLPQIKSHFYHLEAGGRYRDRIDAALRGAGVVLVCWSEKARETRDVWHAEASVARALRKLVACRIDDVEPGHLPDGHGEEQITDLRPDRPAPPGAGGPRRVPRPRSEVDAQVALLVAAVRAKMRETANDLFERRVEQRRPRDPFSPYLIDRADQEGPLGTAIEEVAQEGGARAFLIAGPENECPDEFLERIRRHTSPQRLNGRCWYQVHVEWPFERTPAEFTPEYRRRLASQLGLPTGATAAGIASAIAQYDRPVAILSLMHAAEWTLAEPKRIQGWAAWWQTLANHVSRCSAVPVLCLKMPDARPGWKGCPKGGAPGAAVSNRRIWRALQELQRGPRTLFPFLGSRKATPIEVPPLLHPVRKPDADRWLSERFEMMSTERSAAKTVIDELFGGLTAATHGTSLRDFVAALAPLYR